MPVCTVHSRKTLTFAEILSNSNLCFVEMEHKGIRRWKVAIREGFFRSVSVYLSFSLSLCFSFFFYSLQRVIGCWTLKTVCTNANANANTNANEMRRL